ncbi:MAG: glycoside hydrolase family 116 protein [Ignavibacteriales bacterium]|nr:glycoside hydrolase family 116 protein [Ignavibacteriales bacterium]
MGRRPGRPDGGRAAQHLRHRVLRPEQHDGRLLPRRAQGRRGHGHGRGRRRRGQGATWPCTTRAGPPTTRRSGTASTTSRSTTRSWRRNTSTARAASPTCSSASGWAWSPASAAISRPSAIKSSLQAIYKHNFLTDFRDFSNVQRTYALNDEKGLLLCSWPKGGRPPLPFPYSDEVWTGIEYQVASHLIYEGPRRGGAERRQGRPRPLRRRRAAIPGTRSSAATTTPGPCRRGASCWPSSG